jgi:hypothetical protein
MDLIPGYFRKDSNLTFDSPQGKGRFIVLKKKELNEQQTTQPYNRLEFYKNYFSNLSPSTFDVSIKGENIVIKI